MFCVFQLRSWRALGASVLFKLPLWREITLWRYGHDACHCVKRSGAASCFFLLFTAAAAATAAAVAADGVGGGGGDDDDDDDHDIFIIVSGWSLWFASSHPPLGRRPP